MGGKATKPQPAPDPFATAQAQTGSNVQTAVANSYLGNANERTPYGSVTYKQGKTRTVGGQKVPSWTRTVTLDPAQQHLLDQQNELGGSLNDMAIGQSRRLASHLSQPFDLEGLPEGAGRLTEDWEPYRSRVEEGILSRVNPQMERDYNSLETRLVNQGLTRGSDAFTEAMNEHGRNVNDARIQAFLQSGNEARSASAEERNRGSFNETTRERRLQERKLLRDQPINEITALMNGGQVAMPQFSPYRPGEVAPTPVGDYVYRAADINARNAQTQAQAAGNTWSTIGNIGAGLFRWSDARVKGNIRFVHQDARGINWYVFTYNTYEHLGPQYGVMAQELLDIVPEAVHVDPLTGFYFVDYTRV